MSAAETSADRPVSALERVVGVTAVLALAVPAFAGSFVHVQAVAAGHGQAGWLSWAIAGSPEVLAVLGAVEARRRAGWRRLVVLLVLVVGVTLTVAANVATSDGTSWGLVMAAWCAVAFLLVVLVVETRPRVEKEVGDGQGVPGDVRPADGPAAAGQRAPAAEAPVELTGPLADLLPAGRAVRDELERSGRPLSRSALSRELRARGQRISNQRAADLMAALAEQNGHHPSPTPGGIQ